MPGEGSEAGPPTDLHRPAGAGRRARASPVANPAAPGRDGPWLALSVQAIGVSAAVGWPDGRVVRVDLDDVVDAGDARNAVGGRDGAPARAPAAAPPIPASREALALIDRCLRRADLGLASIVGLAVADGPGPFTAIRVATSLIQGIGIARRLPVMPVPTLAALAATAARLEPGAILGGAGPLLVLTAVDARMQECYIGGWLTRPGQRPCEWLGGAVAGGDSCRAAFEAVLGDRDVTSAGSAGPGQRPRDSASDRDTCPGTGRDASSDTSTDRDAGTDTSTSTDRDTDFTAVLLAGTGFAADPVLAAWASGLVATGWRGRPVGVAPTVEADAVGVLAAALAPPAPGAGWQAVSAARLQPRYLRDKVALDVDEQRRVAAARDAASSRR